MDLKQIINRPITKPFDQAELSFVVEQYILDRKGKEVNITIRDGMFLFGRDIALLQNAFDIASKYFKEKYDTAEKKDL